MKYLNLVDLTEGVAMYVDSEDIEPVELGYAYERIIQPIRAGASAIIRGDYCLSGVVGSKSIKLAINRGDQMIALVAVCLHSRDSLSCWQAIGGHGAPPAQPWAGMNSAYPERIPDWLEATLAALAFSAEAHL